MKDSLDNIYRIARRTAGLTQERWAECLGVSPEVASEDACKLEHAISDESFEAIKNFVTNYKPE